MITIREVTENYRLIPRFIKITLLPEILNSAQGCTAPNY